MRSLGVVIGLLLALTACGGDDSGGGSRDPSVHNGADVDFTTEMLRHHAEALVMVDLTVGRGDDLDPGLVDLAARIRESRAPQIEQLSDWLQEWNEPIPETVRDHVNADHDGHGGHTTEELEQLEQAKGDEFHRLWLEAMIEHHEAAVELAEREIEDGSLRPVRELAKKIDKDQTTEIETMQQLLEGTS